MAILSATIGPIIQTHTGVLLKNDTDQMIVIPLFDENGDQYTGSVTNLGVNFILNGGTDVTLSTTCVYSATAGGHKLTIPSANITALGKYSACVTGDEIGTVLLDGLVIPDFISLAAIKAEVDTAISGAALATAAGLSALNNISSTDAQAAAAAAITAFDTATPIAKSSELSGLVVDLSTVTGGGTATLASLETDISEISITGGSSAEKIVPADKYIFDASAKTLTFSSPYDTLTVEQVTFIKNLTTNYIIWDCRYAGYQTLPIRFGATTNTHVLSFDSSDSDAANTDKIMIVVNQV